LCRYKANWASSIPPVSGYCQSQKDEVGQRRHHSAKQQARGEDGDGFYPRTARNTFHSEI
jgi:hypothetical protein